MYSPTGSRIEALETVPVFSSAVLEASTMGDAALKAEVLQLFRAQFGETAAMFNRLTSAQDWRFAAHALRGTAAAIGALEVASLATLMEEHGLPEADDLRSQAIGQIERAVRRYLAEVAQLI